MRICFARKSTPWSSAMKLTCTSGNGCAGGAGRKESGRLPGPRSRSRDGPPGRGPRERSPPPGPRGADGPVPWPKPGRRGGRSRRSPRSPRRSSRRSGSPSNLAKRLCCGDSLAQAGRNSFSKSKSASGNVLMLLLPRRGRNKNPVPGEMQRKHEDALAGLQAQPRISSVTPTLAIRDVYGRFVR